jgi:lysophospholipase L1-like esterase
MRREGNECALHVYPTGGHGFGFRQNFKYHEQMLNDLTSWLNSHKAPKVGAKRVACIGNSITDGHGIDMAPQRGYPAQLQVLLGSDYWVRNLGVSARTMLNKGDHPYMQEQAWHDAVALRPDVVVIKLGTNDSKTENWKHHDEFEKDLQQMIDELRRSSNPQIFLCTPIPAVKDTWDISDSIITNAIIPIINKVAKKNKLNVIDLHSLFISNKESMMSDGIHPTEKGCQQIAEIVAKAIKP